VFEIINPYMPKQEIVAKVRGLMQRINDRRFTEVEVKQKLFNA